ncbi:hypothetical protein [Halorubrum salsamenti]|uniref:hypothetical protein n=1 Tax=Halorubrum salsamenti TaxID=2583990 RepID=UPI0016425226|nr:hypothetical protein [Halorubrum salsamenti]
MDSSDHIDEIVCRIEREIQRNSEALEEYEEVSYEEEVASQRDVDAEELFS